MAPPVTSSARPRRRAERGFILVAALWMLAALATLASVYSVYVINVAASTHLDDDALRVQAAALSAVELTASKLAPDPEDKRSPSGAFTFKLDRASIRASFVDEGARLDLNAASKETLSALFSVLGAKTEDASGYADNIVAWRKAPANAAQNPEAAAYRTAGIPYAPRQAPFQNVLELRLVRGLPPALIEKALPYLTIFNSRAQVDVRVADPVVLSALPKVTPDAVAKVVSARAKGEVDGDALMKMLGAASSGATAKASPATRVRIEVHLDNGAMGLIEAVILISPPEDDEPYHVLAWRDVSDGSM